MADDAYRRMAQCAAERPIMVACHDCGSSERETYPYVVGIGKEIRVCGECITLREESSPCRSLYSSD